ncbi:hypothetical protein GCM10027454_07050 [Algoriphagus aestuariicola]
MHKIKAYQSQNKWRFQSRDPSVEILPHTNHFFTQQEISKKWHSEYKATDCKKDFNPQIESGDPPAQLNEVFDAHFSTPSLETDPDFPRIRCIQMKDHNRNDREKP